MSETWAFLFGRSQHPVYQRELKGWSYIGLWRKLRRGCLPLMGAVLVIPACCCGLTILLSTEDTSIENLPLVGIALLVGVLIGGEIVKMLAGLTSTALTATAISAEIETQSYGLLRMTPIPPRQIVLAKFAAAIRQIRPAILTVIVVRFLVPVGIIILVVIMLALTGELPSMSPATAATPAPVTGAPPVLPPIFPLISGVAAVVSVIITGLLWLAYYLLQPFLDMMLFAAVGMLGSALSRTRGGGLFAAAGLRIVLGMVSYVASQMFSTLLWIPTMPLVLSPAIAQWLERMVETNPGMLVVGGAAAMVVWLLIVVGAEVGTTLLLLHLSARRAERLPYP